MYKLSMAPPLWIHKPLLLLHDQHSDSASVRYMHFHWAAAALVLVRILAACRELGERTKARHSSSVVAGAKGLQRTRKMRYSSAKMVTDLDFEI